MPEIFIGSPKFCHAQYVCFLGGEGSIKSFKYESETWTYIVEMTLGPEPDFGRIGGETTVLLNETDLRAV
ncbi:hypothetical protein VB780_23610 [Leptolyngbya sp. CCNP1308]|uniref:hypothetical protein n=1 Tax=Leptolyngbya sp. CCNP1308 TaxID=3110255 RepID=UPI002B1EE380|nr:hypothetical protein [Leptolyngbya sp. CCNP1308]MEA5451584.1 hypothetical protein [Leptolyngbya sp. CCNP1308]